MLAFSLTAAESKFRSLLKLMQTAPSLNSCTGTLYLSPGTPDITTSDKGKQSFNVHPGFSTTSCRLFLSPSPR